jgi:hypothetical protein
MPGHLRPGISSSVRNTIPTLFLDMLPIVHPQPAHDSSTEPINIVEKISPVQSTDNRRPHFNLGSPASSLPTSPINTAGAGYWSRWY